MSILPSESPRYHKSPGSTKNSVSLREQDINPLSAPSGGSTTNAIRRSKQARSTYRAGVEAYEYIDFEKTSRSDDNNLTRNGSQSGEGKLGHNSMSTEAEEEVKFSDNPAYDFETEETKTGTAK